MPLPEEDWVKIYEDRGALWLHGGNPKMPHALLSGGDHSNGFFNSGIIAEDPFLLASAADQLREQLFMEGVDLDLVNRVVGPAMGAITWAHSMAERITAYRQGPNAKPCLFAYTVKKEEWGRKWMEFDRTKVLLGESVLLVEDVLTSGASAMKAAAAVEKVGGIVLPYFIVLVNRSFEKEVDGKKIISLIHKPMTNWKSDECLLCKEGSEAIRPKEAGNWARLNAKYQTA